MIRNSVSRITAGAAIANAERSSVPRGFPVAGAGVTSVVGGVVGVAVVMMPPYGS
jgi:hypothetical protein